MHFNIIKTRWKNGLILAWFFLTFQLSNIERLQFSRVSAEENLHILQKEHAFLQHIADFFNVLKYKQIRQLYSRDAAHKANESTGIFGEILFFQD